MNAKKQPAPDAYERACDTCPCSDDCQAYKEVVGPEACLRDDYAKFLMDFGKGMDELRRYEGKNRENS